MPLAGHLILHLLPWDSQGSYFIREHRSFRKLPVLRSTVHWKAGGGKCGIFFPGNGSCAGRDFCFSGIRNSSRYRKILHWKDSRNQRSEGTSGICHWRSEEYRKSPPLQTALCPQCEKRLSTGCLSAEGGCDRAGLQWSGVFWRPVFRNWEDKGSVPSDHCKWQESGPGSGKISGKICRRAWQCGTS